MLLINNMDGVNSKEKQSKTPNYKKRVEMKKNDIIILDR
jgi:hypothetical protein